MCNLKIIKHNTILFSDLLKIISIKSKAWPYSLDKQLMWIVEHMQDDDLHLVLTENGKYVAYMDMVNVNLNIGDKIVGVYGIGNVCSELPGKGYGSKLMDQAGNYLIKCNKVGLLFCHIPLINFYQRFGWQLVPLKNIESVICGEEIRAMVFNIHSLWKSEILSYTDRVF